MIGLMRVLHEVDLTLIPKRLRRARVVEPAGAEPSAEEGRLATEIAGSPLPRAVVFRDSFGSRLAPFSHALGSLLQHPPVEMALAAAAVFCAALLRLLFGRERPPSGGDSPLAVLGM